MVAGPESPQLRQSSLLGPGADHTGVGVEHPAILLTVLLVLRPHVALPQRPVHPHLQRLVQLPSSHGDDAFTAHPDWDVVKQGLGQLLLHRGHVLLSEVRPQQSHPAVDVEAHTARRHHRAGVLHVEGCHVADGKAVAGVNVWQSHTAAHNARQCRHVGDLLDAGQEAADLARPAGVPQLLQHEGLQVRVDVEDSLNLHVGLEAFLYPPAVRTDPLQVLQLLLITPHNHFSNTKL